MVEDTTKRPLKNSFAIVVSQYAANRYQPSYPGIPLVNMAP
jgi:hypothetical protein